MPYDLAKLRQATDKACNAAFDEPERIDEPINWADLGCTSAERYETDDGDTGHRVYIEEAAPNCVNLIAYVQGKLTAAGFDYIEVITEW